MFTSKQNAEAAARRAQAEKVIITWRCTDNECANEWKEETLKAQHDNGDAWSACAKCKRTTVQPLDVVSYVKKPNLTSLLHQVEGI